MEKIAAYAKINLFLDVLCREADGYHGIESVMQTVSLADTVFLSCTAAEKTEISLTCSDPALPADMRNLAFRAAARYLEAVGRHAKVEIRLEKVIPAAAGLAGGSADAAAVLNGMNRQMGNLLSREALCRVGAALGADIPFCLTGGTALCRGRGEILSPLPPMPPCHIVIARGGDGVSTPQAYAALDARYHGFPSAMPHGSLSAVRDALAKGDAAAVGASFYNIFEEVVLPQHEAARQIRSLLKESGGYAGMSGSGPSVFGIFTDESAAKDAAGRLSRLGYFSAVTSPVGGAYDMERGSGTAG